MHSNDACYCTLMILFNATADPMTPRGSQQQQQPSRRTTLDSPQHSKTVSSSSTESVGTGALETPALTANMKLNSATATSTAIAEAAGADIRDILLQEDSTIATSRSTNDITGVTDSNSTETSRQSRLSTTGPLLRPKAASYSPVRMGRHSVDNSAIALSDAGVVLSSGA